MRWEKKGALANGKLILGGKEQRLLFVMYNLPCVKLCTVVSISGMARNPLRSEALEFNLFSVLEKGEGGGKKTTTFNHRPNWESVKLLWGALVKMMSYCSPPRQRPHRKASAAEP